MCVLSPRQTETSNAEVADGRFRMDLYYRLNVFPVHMPSLRERSDDIPILIDYFAARLAGRMGKRIRQIDKRTLDAMQQYSWPGNIRELQNVIERGVILAEGEVFRLEAGAFLSSSVQTVSRPEETSVPAISKRRKSKPLCVKHADAFQDLRGQPRVSAFRLLRWSRGYERSRSISTCFDERSNSPSTNSQPPASDV